MFELYFFAAHPNPANHFVEYAQVLEERGVPYQVFAEKSLTEKFSRFSSRLRMIDSSDFSREEFMEDLLSSIHEQGMAVMDVSSEFFLEFQKRLAVKKPFVKRCVYYDNPEPFVPGGYSRLASKMIALAQYVLFANSSLERKVLLKREVLEESPGLDIDLSHVGTFGVGFQSIKEAESIKKIRREEGQRIRLDFLERHRIKEQGQRIFVYVGGANETYYFEAFPHFVRMIKSLFDRSDESLKNTIFILQQHPRAESEGNFDANEAKKLFLCKDPSDSFQFVVSDLKTLESLAIAQGVFYYQTSMAAQFPLADVPLVAQAAHEMYPDILMKTGFPFLGDPERMGEFLARERNTEEILIRKVEDELGISGLWKENLLRFISNL